jgi:hypothetical protein
MEISPVEMLITLESPEASAVRATRLYRSLERPSGVEVSKAARRIFDANLCMHLSAVPIPPRWSQSYRSDQRHTLALLFNDPFVILVHELALRSQRTRAYLYRSDLELCFHAFAATCSKGAFQILKRSGEV